MRTRKTNRLANVLLGGGFIVALLLSWEVAGDLGWISGYRFPVPSKVADACWELATVGFPDGVTIWTHFVETLSRILQGFALALVTAIPLGIFIGRITVLDWMTLPVITFARSIATLSLLPLVITWFGAGELAKILLIAYGCFWVMLTQAIAAVKYVDPIYIRAAQTLETSRTDILLRVILPAALPRMFAGARTALGVGFMVIVGAEMVGTVKGLGALIMEARRFYRTDLTIAGMVAIGLLGFGISTGLLWLERRLLPWSRGLEEVRRS
jgi:ABC-type nitrate/sulfonate/bicarbonate transport system permease component